MESFLVLRDGGMGGVMPPLFIKFARKLIKSQKVSHAAKELATVFSVTFLLATIVGQLVKTPPPPSGKCIGKSLLALENLREKIFR